ncbi:transposase [Gemmatimonas sp.]|jgi:transposase|uniref:transposase n=1 Tax=Gemmatimonas sp. TaxID=1962908 RepID=UPI0037C077E2
MPRRPAAYPPAYREQIIAMARAGRTPKELAKKFEPSEQTIRNWIFHAEADRGERPDALTSDEREEVRRLRRENRQLKVECDTLGKAAAGFARESGMIPPESSAS